MVVLNEQPSATISIAEAIEQWPQIAPLFVRHHLACYGCDLARFCTFGDIGVYYSHVDLPAFLADLQDFVTGGPASQAGDRRRIAWPTNTL
jgi:hypothetical protein